MPASQLNRLEAAIKIGEKLDQQVTEESVTSWMEGNAGNFTFKGNGVFRIPTIYGSGLGDYRKDLGYPIGSAMMEWNDYTLAYDRGRSYQLDAMDVDESNFIMNASQFTSTLNREYYIPELDATRFARLAGIATGASNSESGYTPAAATIYTKVVTAMYNLMDKGYNELVCHMSNSALVQLALSSETDKYLRTDDFQAGRLYTKVKWIDEMPIIPTPQNRFYTAIDLLDGITAGEESGGYKKAGSAKDINFMIVGKKVPCAIKKHQVQKIIPPIDNQNADAWKINARLYHDLLVLNKKENGVYMNTK